jgi:formate dehydrogenase beta subunit
MPAIAAPNGKRMACVGAGPASLTVARDLAPLGYEVTVFDGEAKAGGFIRSQIPLPSARIGDRRGNGLHPQHGREVPQWRARGVHAGLAQARLRRRVCRMRCATAAAISTCPDARKRLPHPHRHRLAGLGVIRPHHHVGKRVIVLGGGNTAMDCCRSARRMGGTDVKVIVRSGFEEMKASPWEKEDASTKAFRSSTSMCPRAWSTRTASCWA